MKIYQLTLPLHRNYGGILQCWALQTVLRRMGHDVEAVDLRVTRPLKNILLSKWKVMLTNRIHNQNIDYKSELKDYLLIRKFRKRYRKIIKFTDKIQIPCQDVNLVRRDADAWVVGSDQVWRRPYMWMGFPLFYLSFVPDGVKKIAYAPSFGLDNVDEYSSEDCETVARLLPRFDAVSVREKSGIDIIESKGWRPKGDVEHVLDPTLLLTADDYCKTFGLKKVEQKGERAFLYVLDGDTAKIKSCLEAKGYEVTMPSSCDDIFGDIISVEEWLEGIMNADLVVTDSFHCVAFSIIFERKFELQSNDYRGNARLESLLAMLGIPTRSVSDADLFGTLPPIDYSNINAKLDAERNRSLAWLQSALKV